ncbi:hypothetical protein EIP91_002921 [Steccherinum ochraceum]|uniref:FAD-binding PCMH-type domain-containing protein n=1 Tax=Steccherinum ochraceum TaxID=92696 RepID=A0A4V2MW81_9APHY|nr:hypothetical protein EIP91_002921 [Steccherinum ochraceum]
MRSLFVLIAVYLASTRLGVRGDSSVNDTCTQIAKAISDKSDVYWPVDLTGHYAEDVIHWASSSAQASACSVEPGTAQDVAVILQIIGKNKSPFAVRGGGHASNPGFSSTKGVQIAMSRFSQVVYNSATQTADVGPGLVWDDVYAALAPHNVNVVGGRVTGVGMAGFTLGGGYSYLTNQRGLTVDNIAAFELVLPNGTVTTVTEQSNPDLWFGVRGGFNNFGIVTKFTLNTFPQGQVWGGSITIIGDLIDKVNDATVKFFNTVTDPKASLLPTYNFLPVIGTEISLLIFYDAPTPPPGIFDDFLALPALAKDISTRSFLSLVTSSPANATAGSRAVFHTVAVETYDDTFMEAVKNESLFWGPRLALEGASFVSYDIEPFLPTILTHGTSASAYPPVRTKSYLPTNLYYAWSTALSDATMHDAIRQSAAQLTRVAQQSGQSLDGAPLYGNYAIFDTPLESIYGSNLPRLKAIKKQYDPENVMGLAGGWKF